MNHVILNGDTDLRIINNYINWLVVNVGENSGRLWEIQFKADDWSVPIYVVGFRHSVDATAFKLKFSL